MAKLIYADYETFTFEQAGKRIVIRDLDRTAKVEPAIIMAVLRSDLNVTHGDTLLSVDQLAAPGCVDWKCAAAGIAAIVEGVEMSDRLDAILHEEQR